MIGNINGLPWEASMRAALGLPLDIKESLVYQLNNVVEDAEYPNKIGDQDRAAAGGEVFPGRALAFDGADQSAGYAGQELDINQASTDFCFSSWIKPDPHDITSYMVGKMVNISLDGRYGFYMASSNVMYGLIETSTGVVSQAYSVDADSDTDWHLYTVRVDISGSKVYFYLDATLVNPGGTAFTGTFASMASGYAFRIGSGQNTSFSPSTFCPGDVRDVRVYHKDITSAANLTALQNGEALGDEVAWWFCEGTDTLEVHDASGNGYHMTTVNFDSTSFVEGNWQSLMNKYGYAIDIHAPTLIDADKGSFENGTDTYTATPNNIYSEEVDPTAPVGTKVLKVTYVDAASAAVYYPSNNGDAAITGRKYTFSFWYRANAVGTNGSLRYNDGANTVDILNSASVIRDNQWHLATVTFTAEVSPTSIRTWWSAPAAGQIMSFDGYEFKPYYDTAIPPDMSTVVNGIPTTDIFGNALTFAGQAEYKAVARDRSCFIGDGVALFTLEDTITIDPDSDSFEIEFGWHVGTRTTLYNTPLQGSGGTDSRIMINASTAVFADDDNNLITGWTTLAAAITDDEYNVIKFVGDGVNISAYVNGVFAESKAVTPLTSNLIYTKALLDSTGGGFSQHKCQFIKVTKNSLVVANWQFVEGQGDVVYDVSGNGNHLTGVNIDNNNWGVIDTPTEDYLAEYGGNYARVYNGTDDYHSNDVANYLSSATSGSVKVFAYVTSAQSWFFSSADDSLGTVRIYFGVVTSKPRIAVSGNTYNADDALSDGWHEIEYISTGSAYQIKVDGALVDGTISSGVDNGNWYSSVANRDQISIGAILDDTPSYATGHVMWVKVDNGTNGDWYYNPADDKFVDRSSLGLDMSASGTDTEQRIIPSLSSTNTYVANFNGSNSIAQLDIDDFQDGDASGSIKGRVYLDTVGSPLYLFSNLDKNQGSVYVVAQIDVSGKPYLDVRNGGTFWNRIQADDALTAGWYELEFSSNGSSYEIKVDDVVVDHTTIAGADDGKWFSDFSSPFDRINIGSIGDVSPTYGLGKVDWIKVNNGVAGDWTVDPTSGGFVDASSNGNDIPMIGSNPRYKVKALVSSGSSYDAEYQALQYNQGGRNLIPHTYLSMPEDVYELYAADQEERYEGGLMNAGKGTFNEELDSIANVSDCENGAGANGYTTFAEVSSSGFRVTSDGAALHLAGTEDEIVFVTGEQWRVTFDLTLHSGTIPGNCRFATQLGGAAQSNTESPVEGHNSFLFTMVGTDTGAFQFWNASEVTDYTISNLAIKKVLNNSATEEWNVFSSNTITNVDNALEITSVDSALGAYIDLNANESINTNLVIGDTYKLAVRAKTDSAEVDLEVNVGGYGVDESTPVLTTEYQNLELEFVATNATGHNIRMQNMHVGDKVYVDNWELFHKVTATGNNLISNGGARNAIGALTTTDWDKTTGLYDIIAFEDHASTIDGATKVRTLGDELVSNGDFASDTVWTKGTGWAIAAGVASATAVATNAYLYQTISVVDNDWYFIEIDVSNYSAGDLRIVLGGTSALTSVTADGHYRCIVQCGTSNDNLVISAETLAFTGDIDNVSCKRITTATAISGKTDGIVDAERLIDQIPQGAEAITNGDFANWTGDDPDNWSVSGESGSDPEISEVGSGQAHGGAGTGSCNWYTTSADVSILQTNVFTAGKYYLISIDVSNVTSGNLLVQDNLVNTIASGISNVGVHTFVWRAVAAGTSLRIKRQSGATDITVDSVTVKELQVLGSDLVTNGAFTLGSDLQTSNCANHSYDTFANGTPNGFDAIHSTSGTQRAATADELSIVDTQKYIITFDLNLTSGALPTMRLASVASGSSWSSDQIVTAGSNVYEITATATGTGVLEFRSFANTNYQITNLSIKDADTDWSNDDGVIIAGGVAQWDGSQSTFAYIDSADVSGGWDIGDVAIMKFTVSNYSAGNIHPIIAGAAGNGGANITANGTYSVLFVVGNDASNKVHLRGDSNFIGHVDNVSTHKLTWGRQITDDSTNYPGFHYALPIDEFDFAIPVDYVSESIVAQQFHDGMADGVTWLSASYPMATSIVTGNGFSGKAQRFVENNSINYAALSVTAVQFVLGQEYRISGKYRSSATLNIHKSSGPNYTPSLGAANTGDAAEFSIDITAADSTGWYIAATGSEGVWIEIDEFKIQRIIDGEFYEPEALGGDPVIIDTNYFAENPSRYLTRYFNAQSWKDLLLLESDHDLDYTDHTKLMRFTKNS